MESTGSSNCGKNSCLAGMLVSRHPCKLFVDSVIQSITLCRELVIQLPCGSLVFLYYLDYTFMCWNLKLPKVISGVQGLQFYFSFPFPYPFVYTLQVACSRLFNDILTLLPWMDIKKNVCYNNIFFFILCQICSMAGKQVYDVPPTNVGGSHFCVAVCTRGVDIQKVGCNRVILITVFINFLFYFINDLFFLKMA